MSISFSLIGRRIKEIRKTKGATQAGLAEQIDMSVSYISRIETATVKPSLSTLVLIANALGTTVDTLLNGNQVNDSNLYFEVCSRSLIRNLCSIYSELNNNASFKIIGEVFE